MAVPIKVLTWNVSFGAMSGSDNDMSARPLPSYCKSKGKHLDPKTGQTYTECLNNVVNLIDASGSVINYDFVALQEASKWNVMFNKSEELKRAGGYIHHIIKRGERQEEMVTFYDIQKYNLLAVKIGSLVENGARPYQILFLQGNSDRNFYIFINLHNGHDITKDELQQKLSNNLINALKFTGFKTKENMLESEQVNNIFDIINGKEFKVIVAGDFNDNRQNYWQGLQPFRHTTYSNLKDILVNAEKKPPNTCCIPDASYTDIRVNDKQDKQIGDYILVNDKMSIVIDNKVVPQFVYNAGLIPTSDHLPVEILLLSTPRVISTHPARRWGDYKVIEGAFSSIFNITEQKTLRLLNNFDDPKIPRIQHASYFRGKIIEKTDHVMFPCEGKTKNNYILVYSRNDPNKIGYINFNFIDKINKDDYRLKSSHTKEILRLQDNIIDPKSSPILNKFPHEGLEITSTDILNLACGKPTREGLVLVQKFGDTNTIGYVNNIYIQRK